jgi:hypothetical protein
MKDKFIKKSKFNETTHKSIGGDKTDETNKIIFLNGPINYFKLSKNNTRINIFMDFHAPINRQRKCEEYESKDIDKYFHKLLSTPLSDKSNTDTLDFFLEINPTSINFKNKYYSNDNYLASIRKMFSKLYNQKYSDLDKDDMPQENIRLHYMDIRDYASFNAITKKIDIILLDLDKNKLDNLNFVNIELVSIKNILTFLNSMIDSIINKDDKTIYSVLSTKKIDYVNLKEISEKFTDKTSNISVDNEIKKSKKDSKKNLKKDSEKDSEQLLDVNMVMDVGLYQILQKILLNYTNSNNKDNIINLFSEHYIKTSRYVINKLDKLIIQIAQIDKIIDDYVVEEKITFEEINSDKNDGSRDVLPYYFYSMKKYKKSLREIIDSIEEIDSLIMKMGVIMTDCYFLRRLTDNSKIQKSIIYTGAYHSVIYLWFLIKYNDFIIEDYYYLKDNMSTQKIVEIIKKSDYLDIMKYVIPDKINQCVKIKEL